MLRKITKPQMLTFSVDPQTEDLPLFYRWLLFNGFKVGVHYGDFQLAQKMGVHRTLSDHWLRELVYDDFAISKDFVLSDNQVPGFVLTDIKPVSCDIRINWNGLDLYDPWVHREYDGKVDGALWADVYIDKFYDVNTNEHYIVLGKARKRVDGKLFAPIPLMELPRYAKKNSHRYEGKPAPIEWKKIIENTCYSED